MPTPVRTTGAAQSPAAKAIPGSGIERAVGTLRAEFARIAAAAQALRAEVEAGKAEGAARTASR